MASPPKRRTGVLRSVADQPMRQTRSMARIAAPTDSAAELWSSSQHNATVNTKGRVHRHEELELSDGLSDAETNPLKQALKNSLVERRAANAADHGRRHQGSGGQSSPSKPRRSPQKPMYASQAPRYEFGPDSPRHARPQHLKMDSPRKGRVDDFEFELEHSLVKYRPAAATSGGDDGNDDAPSSRNGKRRGERFDLGLPRSRAIQNLGGHVSRQHRPSEYTDRRAGRNELNIRRSPTKAPASARSTSPTKPLTVPNPFSLGSRASSLQDSHGDAAKRPHSTMTPSASNESIKAASGDRGSGNETSRSHIFKSIRSADVHAPQGELPEALMPSSVFTSAPSSDRNRNGSRPSSRGEASTYSDERMPVPSAQAASRSSPVKVVAASFDAFAHRPPSPRKPIDLARLKPSPGKARRGMFLHETDEQEEDEQDADDVDDSSGSRGADVGGVKQEVAEEDEDDYVLTPGPLPVSSSQRRISGKVAVATGNGPTSGSADSSAATLKPSASHLQLDVKQTLSSETSSALASLEASLAKLSAHSHRRTSSIAPKKEAATAGFNVKSSPPKRTLGDNRPRILSPSKAQNAALPLNAPAGTRISSFDSSARERREGSESGDGVFKKPSTFLMKSRTLAQARSEHSGSEAETSHHSIDSSSSHRSTSASAKDPAPHAERAARVGSAATATTTASEAAEAEAKRRAALKAARRGSMHSVLSFGSNPSQSALKREHSPVSGSAFADSSFASAPGHASLSAADSKMTAEEAKKAAKAARRRSLYTYVPTKRDDAGAEAGDRSVGNMSSGLIIGGVGSISNAGDADLSPAAGGNRSSARARYLRCLTVLVDVRDQDGEDASACWIEMLKDAGAKVLVRFGERQLTHIVYKSGRPSTLHSYRALPEPKPLVVGISWVVKCLEEGRKVEEEPYIVEVGKQAIFQKRRRSSMAPRQAPHPSSTSSSSSSAPRNPLTISQQEKHLALVRAKVMEHAPVIPSPLRWRCYQASISSGSDERSSTPESEGPESDGLERFGRTVEHALKRGRVGAIIA